MVILTTVNLNHDNMIDLEQYGVGNIAFTKNEAKLILTFVAESKLSLLGVDRLQIVNGKLCYHVPGFFSEKFEIFDEIYFKRAKKYISAAGEQDFFVFIVKKD